MTADDEPVDAGFQQSLVHGERGCDNCGGLLCVKQRELMDGKAKGSKTVRVSDLVTEDYDVNVAADVTRIVCASCGAVLWERGE